MSVPAASMIVGMRILHHYVAHARRRRDLSGLRKVGVDEASVRKGHNCVSVFCDIGKSTVVDVEDGRDSFTITRFREWVEYQGRADPEIDPELIKQFCCDMSPACVLGIDRNFPEAEITFDRYHVLAMINKALDTVRRQERAVNEVLKNTRHIWLMNPPNPTKKQRDRLDGIKNLDLRTARAYHIKTALQRLWEHDDPAQAENYLKKWYFWATRSCLEPIVKGAKPVRNHWDGASLTRRIKALSIFIHHPLRGVA